MADHPFRCDDPAVVTPDELERYLEFINVLADASREVISPFFRNAPEMVNKVGRDYYDPVTQADRDGEEAIRKLIDEHFPDHGIFGEEHGYKEGSSPLTWVIDPIDGTRAFVLGLPLWGTLISLHDGAKPILGLLDQPYMEERYTGAPGIDHAEGKSRNGCHRLTTRPCTDLAQASMSSTHPSMFKDERTRQTYEDLTQSVRLHSFGGDCYAYAMVALGTHDLVIENSLQVYDIQAHIPIIEAAGGVISAWDGGPADLGGSALVSSTPKLHEQVLERLRPAVSSGS